MEKKLLLYFRSLGNTNLNHPLQSLHAMHPGGGGGGGAGGGEILSSDMGNPDATVAALVAAQMSLNRSHVTNETGVYRGLGF